MSNNDLHPCGTADPVGSDDGSEDSQCRARKDNVLNQARGLAYVLFSHLQAPSPHMMQTRMRPSSLLPDQSQNRG